MNTEGEFYEPERRPNRVKNLGPSSEKYIYLYEYNGVIKYKVLVQRHGFSKCKVLPTIEEAIIYRDSLNIPPAESVGGRKPI